MKNRFIEAKKTRLVILRGCHKNPYKFENAMKSSGTVFCIYHMGLIVYQGSVYDRKTFLDFFLIIANFNF